MLRFRMEHTLFELAVNSLVKYVDFFERLCRFEVSINSMGEVVTRSPGSSDPTEELALFSMELVGNTDGFAFSTRFEKFEEVVPPPLPPIRESQLSSDICH